MGGMKQYDTYIIDSISFQVAESTTYVRNIGVHTNYIYSDPEKVFGNLGQDYISQFENMILSFKYSSILFQ